MITVPDSPSVSNPGSEPIPEAVAIGFSCRAIAESLMQTRRRVAVIDCCGDLDTRLCTDWVEVVDSLADTAAIISVLEKWFHEFGPMPVLLGGGTENHPELLSAIGQRWPGTLPGANWETLRDWNQWEQWAKAAGFPFPKTVNLCELSQLEASHFDEFDGQPILLKNLKQSGGLGVKLYADLKTVQAEISRPSQELTGDSWVVQQALPGRVLGVHFFSSGEKNQVLGVVEGIPTESHPNGDFVYLGSRGPVHLRAVEALLLERFADIVTTGTGLKGNWNADFLETQQGWHLLEINPRWSAGLEVLELCAPPVATTATGETIANQSHAPKFAIKRIIYADQDFQISQSQVQSLIDASSYGAGQLSGEHIADTLGASGNESVLGRATIRVADIPVPETNFKTGMPLCTLLVTGHTREEVSRALILGKKWLDRKLTP